MPKRSAVIFAAFIVMAGTISLTSAAYPVLAAGRTTYAHAATSSHTATSGALPSGGSNSSAKLPTSHPGAAVGTNSLNKIDQAKAIVDGLKNLDHPEQKIQTGSLGWQEERRAATESSQGKLREAQFRLTALGSIIAPVLADGLRSEKTDVSTVCTAVLVQFGADSVPAIVSTIKKYGMIPNAVVALKQIGSDSLPPLLEMLKSSDSSESMTALTTLNLIADTGNNRIFRPSLMIQFNPFYRRPHNENVIFSSPAIEQLCNIETNKCSIKFKQQLADLLGKIGPRGPQVAPKLVSLITKEEQPEVRASAIVALGNIVALQRADQANQYADVIISSLKKDDYAGCRAEAANALGHIPALADKSVPVLSDALKDGYPEVANASLLALGSLGVRATAALPDLLGLAQNSSDMNVQLQALNAIGNMRDGAAPAMPFLSKCLSGNVIQLKQSALRVVSNVGPAASSTVSALIPLLADVDMRAQVVRALEAIGPGASSAVPALRDLLKTSPDPDRFGNRRQIQQALKRITGETQDVVNGSPAGGNSSPLPPTIRIQTRDATSI